MSLIFKHQLETQTSEILDELLYQEDENKIVTERNIYKRALKHGIISQQVFEQLSGLYGKRNQIIHRYIISDITTEQVLTIAEQYQEIIDKLKYSIYLIQEKQIDRGIGIVKHERDVPPSLRGKAKEQTQRLADEKHGNADLARNLRTSKNNRAG